MWVSEYTGENIDAYFGNKENNDKLSEKLGLRIMNKVKKMFSRKLKIIRERLEAKRTLMGKNSEVRIEEVDENCHVTNPDVEILEDEMKKEYSSADVSIISSKINTKDDKKSVRSNRLRDQNRNGILFSESSLKMRRNSQIFDDRKPRLSSNSLIMLKNDNILFYTAQDVISEAPENVENDAELSYMGNDIEKLFQN
jgi:hypothetical protein